MRDEEQATFRELIAQVLAFYNQKTSAFALGVWWEACRPFELDAVQHALSRHALDTERGQFCPKPADIIRQIQGTPVDRAARAWGLIMQAIRHVGMYADVVFDDPTIHAAIEDMGGWPLLCQTEAARLSYAQHRFTESYSGYIHRNDLQRWPRQLSGLRSADEVFASVGLPPPTPVLIGNPERARCVFSDGDSGRLHAITVFDDFAAQALARIAKMPQEMPA